MAFWIVERTIDGAILATNKKWYAKLAGIECIKYYSTAGRAIRYGLNGSDGTVSAVYPGDVVDCLGNITKKRNLQ